MAKAKGRTVQAETVQETPTGKRGRKSRPEGMNDKQYFLSEAPGRVTRVIAALQTLGRLAADGFDYSGTELNKMRLAIDAALVETFSRLENRPKTVKKNLFRF